MAQDAASTLAQEYKNSVPQQTTSIDAQPNNSTHEAQPPNPVFVLFCKGVDMINRTFTTDTTLAEHRRNLILFNENKYMTSRIRQLRRNSKSTLAVNLALGAVVGIVTYTSLIAFHTFLLKNFVNTSNAHLYNDEQTLSYYALRMYNSHGGMIRLREKYSRREIMRSQLEQYSMQQQIHEAEVKLAKIHKGMSY